MKTSLNSAILAIAFLLACSCNANNENNASNRPDKVTASPSTSPPRNTEQQPASDVLKNPGAIRNFFEKMLNQSNQLIVEREYLGRWIEVSGKVLSVGYADDGSGIVFLVVDPHIEVNWPGMVGKQFVAFHYGFQPSEKDRLANFQQGSPVTLRGKLTNFNKVQGEINYRAIFSESQLL